LRPVDRDWPPRWIRSIAGACLYSRMRTGARPRASCQSLIRSEGGDRAELGNAEFVVPARPRCSWGAGAMTQAACITPRELFAELLSTRTAYSATEVVGGKLRALYDDAAQPCPTRMMQILRKLDAKEFDCALTQIPHFGTIS
jgi:hypothetical protein